MRNFVAVPAAAAACLCLFAGLSGCGGGAGGGGRGGPVAVETDLARSERVPVTVRAVGNLRAVEEVEVRAERDGRVRSIHFEEGSEVERGDLLVRLNDEEIAARVEELEARVRQARALLAENEGSLERRRPLLERQLVSVEEFRAQEQAVEAARAELEAHQAALRQARKARADTRIVAPAAGTTGDREISVGDYVQQGDLLVELYQLDPMEVTFRVPERHLARLQRGQVVELRVAAFPEEAFTGRIVFLDPAVDPVTRTVALKARIGNEDLRLLPGLFAQVDVLLQVREDSVVIPEQALVPREDGDFVFVVEEGTAHRRRVRIGERLAGEVEILQGIVPGEEVVTAGQPKLGEGAPVRIIEPEAPAEQGG